MSDLDPAVVDVFNSLVDERGGPKAFNSFQAECALAIAQSMIDVHDAGRQSAAGSWNRLAA
jgi:hypothetical protein